jgi:hypothetical protein
MEGASGFPRLFRLSRCSPGHRCLLFLHQESAKDRDISEKNFTAKSNRTKGSQSKKEGEKGIFLRNLFNFFDFEVKISSILVFLRELKVNADALLSYAAALRKLK